jgi:hypothetical protein
MTPAKWPPEHLRPETRAWCSSVDADYELEDHHRRLLVLAGESWDRSAQAREEIDQAGPYYVDRFGSPKPHPALTVERDCRLAFARLVKALELDAAEPLRRPVPKLGG